MSEVFKYLSPEWGAEAEKRLNKELSPEQMNHITSSMTNIYLNCPGGKQRFILFKFTDGCLSQFTIGDGEAPDAEFKIIGEYETYSKISRAEIGAQTALMSGKLKLKGNMVKALRLASLCDRLNKVLSTIPSEY